MSGLDPIKRVSFHQCSALHSKFVPTFFSPRSFIRSVPLCAIFDSESLLPKVEKADYSQAV